MKRILTPLITLGLLASVTAKAAIPVTRYDAYIVEIPQQYAAQGWYWGFSGGANFMYPTNMRDKLVNGSNGLQITDSSLPGVKVNAYGGEFISLCTGYRIYGWRFEAELDYRHNKWSKVNNVFTLRSPPVWPPNPIVFPQPTTKQGDTIIGTLFLNLDYDWYWTTGWIFTLGIGGGYSYAYYDANLTSTGDHQPFPGTPNSFAGANFDFSGSGGNWVGQIMAGLSYRWNAALETGISYRLMARPAIHYNVHNRFANGWTVEFEPKYVANTISIDFRFT